MKMRSKKMLLGILAVGVVASAAAATKAKHQYTIHGKDGQDVGTVTISPAGHNGVHVKIVVHDLPFGPHGVHFHQNPVCDPPDFHSSGAHFNPDGKQHGFENPMGHHAGDTPENLMVGEDHRGEVSYDLHALSFDPSAPNSVFGTSLIVHEHADDERTDPSGNSGNRIACAVIQP